MVKGFDIPLFGDTAAKNLFIQMVDEHDMELMDSEAAELERLSGRTDWCVAAVPVGGWYQDLTPWKAAPAFGKQGFGDGAAQTLKNLLEEILPGIGGDISQDISADDSKNISAGASIEERRYFLCGYSLAGLFALWAAYQTDVFFGVVAVSPSVWYPKWIDYAKEHTIKVPKVYLSLGKKEEKTKNRLMASVGDAIREQEWILSEGGICCQLDWNEGNHFVESDLRMAKGMAWVVRDIPHHIDGALKD